MRIFSVIMFVAVALVGCQSSEERAAIAQRNAMAKEQKEMLAAAMASKKISFANGVRAMNDIDRADNPNPSRALREAMLYQEALADKVDNNQITVKEYLYLTEKQRNEVFSAAETEIRQERMASAAEQIADSRPSFSQIYATRMIRGY